MTHDPLVVNTKDGAVWMRRAVTRDGRGLYSVADAPRCCPEFVMATLTELAEHGIAGSADALPMPVGPKPLVLSEQQIDALAAAGNRVVNDAVHQDLCMCDAWPEKRLSTGAYFMGAWDVSGLETALPAVLGLWESMRGGELVALRARLAEFERPADKLTRLFAPVQALREDEPAEEKASVPAPTATPGPPNPEPARELPQIAVGCPACDARPGYLCTSHSGTRPRRDNTHQARRAAWANTQNGGTA
ncbi:hypothetical protein [Streptomyces phaeochromogenes]|uniref:zinc finger domain-containing protein n=1 Tax=Streptomyces phaeochromogenes TaxID=1923 RepID=UPI003863A268|nr:hypothetical protein OG277_29005 [Streptomyces phaeochromogenes]